MEIFTDMIQIVAGIVLYGAIFTALILVTIQGFVNQTDKYEKRRLMDRAHELIQEEMKKDIANRP